MKVANLGVLVTIIALAGLVHPTLAHHSLTAEFDSTKAVTMAGVVTKVEWMNPHVWFYVDVRDSKSGKVTTWAFLLNSPNALAKQGWSRTTLRTGDMVSVYGLAARDGWPKAITREIRFADGKVLEFGPEAVAR